MRRLTRFFCLTFGYFTCLALITACSPPEKTEVQAKKPVPVQIITATAQDLPVKVEAVGRLTPDREVVLAAEVGGIIHQYMADVGDSVKTGQLLVEIDSDDYRLALKEAEANLAAATARLNSAEKTYKRLQALLSSKVISHDTFEKAEAGYETALAVVDQVKALVNIAENRLEKTKITASFAGTVAARMVEKGQMAGPGQAVMKIVDLSRIRVRVYLPERDFVYLDEDDPVAVSVDAYPEKMFNGRVDEIGVQADVRTNTFAVEILIDNPELLLKAGLSARVWLTTRTISNAIMVPQSCILYKNEQKNVFIVDPDKKARLRVVDIGITEGSMIQIRQGLKSGEKLVITGSQYLEPGDTVTILTPKPAPPA